MPVVHGYIRVSTADQVDSGLSLEHQREAVRKEWEYRYKDQGWQFGRVYEDRAESGTKPLSARKAGFRLSVDLEDGDVVVIPKLDRGFRNIEDLLQQLRLWTARGIRIVFLDLKIDSMTDTGRMVIGMMGLVAEWERSRISQRTKEALEAAKRRGKRGGRPIFGIKMIGQAGSKKPTVDAEAFAIGKKIVQWKVNGYSWDNIYFHLRREGIDRPLNGKEERKRFPGARRPWSFNGIRRAYASTLKVMGWIEAGKLKEPD